jgi:glutamyl-tRNA(Gln) amidotransferase subunit E
MAARLTFAGVKVGIEIHQQLLSSRKLYCSCPPAKSEELPFSFVRRLRPAQSELGQVDPAALFEFSKGKVNRYLWSPESSCLVDADEEPPHLIDDGALDSALLVAATLGSHIVDEVHVMRKIVIDGSNTTGFQRTAVVGIGGEMMVDGVKVGVQSVTIEEDAARILGEDQRERRFALDRLGVPLVEVALDPVVGDPDFVGKVALHLGRILRSTGRMARGLGTIRQDLNVSTPGSKVVEVKGVQKLNLVPRVVAYEAKRQIGLMQLADMLKERGIAEVTCEIRDVTIIMKDASSKALRDQVEAGGIILCVSARGLGGLMGWEPIPGIRLGRELAEVARASSLGGVIHSDEFQRQGITASQVAVLMKETGTEAEDALVLVAGAPEPAGKAARAILQRLEFVPKGVPAETRAATDGGETRYMRPRPGSERMYPETDIPDILVSEDRITKLEDNLPEHWETVVERLARRYSLSRDLALKIYDSELLEAFEKLSKSLKVDPSVIASTLVEAPVRLTREGVPEDTLSLQTLSDVLGAVDAGRIAKEAIPDVLRTIGGKHLTVSQAIESLGIRRADESEIGSVVDSVLARHTELLQHKGEEAFSALMGEAMAVLRGRADGAEVGRILKEKLRVAVRRI